MARQKYKKGIAYKTTRKIGGVRRKVKIVVTGSGKNYKQRIQVLNPKTRASAKTGNKRNVGKVRFQRTGRMRLGLPSYNFKSNNVINETKVIKNIKMSVLEWET